MRTSVRSGPEEREVRVRVEREAEPPPRGSVPAEAALDHAAVEEQGRVTRTEPERALRPTERLARSGRSRRAPTRARRPPGSTAARASLPGQRERSPSRIPWSTSKSASLEVRVDAVCGAEPLDRADQLVLLAGAAAFAARGVQVGERGDELRQRHGLGGRLREPDRAPRAGRGRPRRCASPSSAKGIREGPPARRWNACRPARARPGRSGACRARRASTRSAPARRRRRRARAPWPRRAGRGRRPARAHRRCGRTRRGRACSVDHPVEGAEGLVVAAELDQRVADQRRSRRAVAVRASRAATEPQRLAEPCRREASEPSAVARPDLAGSSRDARSRPSPHGRGTTRRPSRVPAGGTPGRAGRASLRPRTLATVCFQPRDGARRVAEREAVREGALGRHAMRTPGPARRRRRADRTGLAEHAAEQDDERGRDDRRRRCQDSRAPHPLRRRGGRGRSPDGARQRTGRSRRNGCSFASTPSPSRLFGRSALPAQSPKRSTIGPTIGRSRTRARAARCR